MIKISVSRSADETDFPLLAPSNFSSLLKIEDIHLSRCGIEIILDHTFDPVSRSLMSLSLDENKIKRISVEQFGKFLNGKQFRLIIDENPFACDCNFYLMESITLRIYRNLLSERRIRCISDGDGVADQIEHCSNVQRVRARNGCFSMRNGTECKYPRYELRFRTNITGKFMLWVNDNRPGSRKMGKCQIRQHTYNCFILYDGLEIPMNWNFDRSNIIFMNVVFVHAVRALVSPLHWMTVHKSVVARDADGLFSIIYILPLGIFGVFIGILMAFLWSWRASMNIITDTAETKDNVSDVFYY